MGYIGAIWFAALAAGLLVIAANRPLPYVIETHHHVEVLRKLAYNMWEMRDNETGVFRYTGCPDFNNESVIWPGYVADHAIWEEQGRCKSIRDTGLGFFWEHDDQGNVKETTNARTAGQMGSN